MNDIDNALGAEVERLTKAVAEQTEMHRKWQNRARSRASKLVELRATADAVIAAGLAVADRWDADDVSAELMDYDIGRLRAAIGRAS